MHFVISHRAVCAVISLMVLPFAALLETHAQAKTQAAKKGAPPAPATAPQARTYTIAASDSSFTVFVGKAGLLSGLAHDHLIAVKSFGGRVNVANDMTQSTLQFEADAKSFAVLDKEVSEKDRADITKAMHEEVIESAKHPKLTFNSVSITNVKPAGGNAQSFTLSGDLTLHGVTKRITVPVTVTITPQQLRAMGSYTLKQTDFGIKPYSAGLGAVKVKNEVTVNFSIVAK